MALSSLAVLALQSVGMALGTFLCGVVPLYLSLSKTTLRILEVVGSGLLVGASMTVVLPEGVNQLYSTSASTPHVHEHSHAALAMPSSALQDSNAWAWTRLSRRIVRERPPFNPESTLGMTLLSGFLIMFLIDQIASPGAHAHAPSSSSSTSHAHTHAHDREPSASSQWHQSSFRTESMRLTRASSLVIPTTTNKNARSSVADIGDSSRAQQEPSTESSPEQLPADHDFVTHMQDPLLRQDSHGHPRHPRRPSDAGSRASSTIKHSRSIRHAFAPVAGLIIHAAADGIAMGASAGSGDDSLKLVVLFAIMLHKAPASFGLCTLLMGQRLHKSDIRKAIAFFSMATPVGALATYLFLAVLLKSDSSLPSPPSPSDSPISSQHIGAALTFSAGTFLFVAMHAVQELASAEADIDIEESHHHHHHHHGQSQADQSSQPPKQILGRTGRVAVFVLGTILPKVMQNIVGHHH